MSEITTLIFRGYFRYRGVKKLYLCRSLAIFIEKSEIFRGLQLKPGPSRSSFRIVYK